MVPRRFRLQRGPKLANEMLPIVQVGEHRTRSAPRIFGLRLLLILRRVSSHLTDDDERDKAVFSGCICTDFDHGKSSEAVGSGSS